jgi:hypothetical protein
MTLLPKNSDYFNTGKRETENENMKLSEVQSETTEGSKSSVALVMLRLLSLHTYNA